MPESNNHLEEISKMADEFQSDPLYQKWLSSLSNKIKRSESYKDMVLEQEHLQFLMDHHLFYWKMDRFMLRVDQRPLPAQIAQDRYLAHGARQNLLELWKKKDLLEKRNLIQKDT